MPIEGLPSSNQQAAAAANAAMITTGAERQLQQDKVKKLVDLDRKEAIDLYGEMISPEVIAEINLHVDESPNQEQALARQKDIEALRKERKRRLEEYKRKVKIARLRGSSDRPKGKKRFLRQWDTENDIPPPLAEFADSVMRIKALSIEDLDLIKEYLLTSSKIITGKPPEDLDKNKSRLEEIKIALKKLGLNEVDFNYLEQKASLLMKEGLLFLFRREFFSSGRSAEELSKWIISSKGGKVTMDMVTLLEEFSVPIQQKLLMLQNLEILEILALLDFLNIDISAWIRNIEKSKILMDHSDISDLYFHVAGMNSASDISQLISEYRSRRIEVYLETSFGARINKNFQLMMLRRRLNYLGMAKEDIEELNEQSQRVAWLKAIATLKTLHLNRILTTSSREFDSASKKITRLTAVSRGIGKNISKESIKWIEAGLEKTALAAAKYKLELLQSLQKMNFDKKRKFDIDHLTVTIATISKKLSRN